jgi:hypothetical protein
MTGDRPPTCRVVSAHPRTGRLQRVAGPWRLYRIERLVGRPSPFIKLLQESVLSKWVDLHLRGERVHSRALGEEDHGQKFGMSAAMRSCPLAAM